MMIPGYVALRILKLVVYFLLTNFHVQITLSRLCQRYLCHLMSYSTVLQHNSQEARNNARQFQVYQMQGLIQLSHN